jgi:hypothetical protein
LTVTTTTLPRRASLAPLDDDPAAYRNAPPWNQTSTGRRRSSRAGVHTFSDKHSSSVSPTSRSPRAVLAVCMASFSRAGGANRSGPNGG